MLLLYIITKFPTILFSLHYLHWIRVLVFKRVFNTLLYCQHKSLKNFYQEQVQDHIALQGGRNFEILSNTGQIMLWAIKRNKVKKKMFFFFGNKLWL